MNIDILTVGLSILFILTVVTPMTLGYDVVSDRLEVKEAQSSKGNSGHMDFAWSMYCHDIRHTGRSSYSTASNLGEEKWKLRLHGKVWGHSIIDNDGIIYIGAWDFYAINPNGTIKWRIDIGAFSSAGAIDENGIIYVGTIWAMPNYLYAIYSNNGTIKWKYKVPDHIYSSPAIGDDGTIYFGCLDENIYALYPNGTLKWKYKTNYVVYSSPAIADDGTVYCGSHDTYLYALYPKNGTIKWKYNSGDWVARGPSIADDGTIYFGSWDGYLYAVYPDGTLKWKTGGYLAGTTPITGSDGTIYVGNKQLYAIYPENGTVKWSFNLEQNEDIRGSNPCISTDGTIYFGTFEGGRIYAVNNDGTEKWSKSIGGDVISAPAIGEDGTVYIGDGRDDGYLYAFGESETNYPPDKPNVYGPLHGRPGVEYDFSFNATDPEGDNVSYYIEWGDGTSTGWTDYFPSGDWVWINHSWNTIDFYPIRCKAKDIYNEGNWSDYEIDISVDKAFNFNLNLLEQLFERFPILSRLLYLIK